MNTHDKIELPPLPKGDIAADTCPVMWVHSDAQLQAYARDAIEADRKRRGEPIKPQPSGDAGELPDAVRVPLDSLHADAGYLIGRVMDESLTRDEAVAVIRSCLDEARAKLAALHSGQTKPLIARPLAEWHEDDGPVMWWAWCGTPMDDNWPGYHTHWTPHPDMPAAASEEQQP